MSTARIVVNFNCAQLTNLISDKAAQLAATGGRNISRRIVHVRTHNLQNNILADKINGLYAWYVSEVYAAMTEYGGTIYPVKYKYLHWKDENGKDIYAKKVVIPPNPYMRPAAQDVANNYSKYVAQAAIAAMAIARRNKKK
jgi:hypothetical protein